MRTCYYLLLLLIFISCNNDQPTDKKQDIVVNLKDNVPVERSTVATNAVDSFGETRVESNFSVKIYETAKTFRYLVKVQYHGHTITDTLKVPNFGTWPKVAIKKADINNSCIIGFLDKDQQFKEYKQVTGVGDKLKIKILKRYAVETYRADE